MYIYIHKKYTWALTSRTFAKKKKVSMIIRRAEGLASKDSNGNFFI
jgi:hypothetical protein